MTVRELITWLEQYPDDFVVVLASDEEGNDFHEAYELGHGIWRADDRELDTWYYDESDDPPFEERPLTRDESTAVCIWP